MVSAAKAPAAVSYVVRRATADDAPLIAELYDGLSPRSVHTRFSSSMTPDALRRAASVGDDTVCLVATSDGRVVGEARYVLWEGAHELAVTVADASQGHGLGRLLVDRLRAEAHERGITSLRAVVQVDNPAMLRVLEKLGLSIVRPTDGTEVVVDVATDEYMPDWGPTNGRTRVLVESRGLWENPEITVLRRAGFDIRQCPGPRASGEPGCPLVVLGRCRLVEQADVVAHLLPAGDEACAEIARAHGRGRPGQVVAHSVEEWRETVPTLVPSRSAARAAGDVQDLA